MSAALWFDIQWLLIGAVAAGVCLLYVRSLTAEKQHKLFGNSLIIVALIYVAFALVWGDSRWLMIELTGALAYGFLASIGMRSPKLIWLLGAGWLAHIAWDVFVHLLGPGLHIVPLWYAIACASFDLVFGLYLLIVLRKRAHLQTVN